MHDPSSCLFAPPYLISSFLFSPPGLLPAVKILRPFVGFKSSCLFIVPFRCIGCLSVYRIIDMSICLLERRLPRDNPKTIFQDWCSSERGGAHSWLVVCGFACVCLGSDPADTSAGGEHPPICGSSTDVCREPGQFLHSGDTHAGVPAEGPASQRVRRAECSLQRGYVCVGLQSG